MKDILNDETIPNSMSDYFRRNCIQPYAAREFGYIQQYLKEENDKLVVGKDFSEANLLIVILNCPVEDRVKYFEKIRRQSKCQKL